MTKRKKKIVVVCAVMLIAALTVGGTLAYFFDQATATNEFTTAGTNNPDTGVDIDVVEPDWEEDEAQDSLPGDTIAKNPTVTNNRGNVYVRFIVELQDEDGSTITDKARADKIMDAIIYSNGAIDTNTSYSYSQIENYPTVNSQFTLDSGRSTVGKYYYNYTANNGIMTNGQSAELFDFVVIPTDWTQTDIAVLGNFNIVVTAQAIQAENIANADAAFKALDNEITKAGQ